ncbi:MAG: hypothetical protein Q9180_008752, partial [Flavoplaca navasiana]
TLVACGRKYLPTSITSMASINAVNEALAPCVPYVIVSYHEDILIGKLPTLVFDTIKLINALKKRKPTAEPPLKPIERVSPIDRVTAS